MAVEWPDGVTVDLRYRLAHIDQVGYAHPADANTLRLTLGYLWQPAAQWSAYVEGTDVESLFGGHYNSGANGRNNLPAEGDPPSSEISSAWVGYDSGDVIVRVGRQYVNLDNQRFFTSGLWRQNPQSFDALALAWRPHAGTTLRYLYLDHAQRSVGHDYPDSAQREWSLAGHLLHADQDLPLGKLTLYDYLVENRTQARNSLRTAGLRWTGEREFGATQLGWTAEIARQNSWRNNPQVYAADYHLGEITYGYARLAVKVGDEVLGGNGRVAFSAPYGSNHGFNGWTSQFRNVPANGLDDRYVGIFGAIAPRLGWAITNHNFFAERGSRRYGSELDAQLKYAVWQEVDVEIDYATYHSNGFAASERVLWLAVEYRHGAPGGG